MDRRIANNNIKSLRQRFGMTQRELSRKLSRHTGNMLDVTTVSKHETGSRNPTTYELIGYANVFGVPVYSLYRDIVTL